MLQAKRIFFFLATLLCGLTASAQGKAYVGYCGGEIATTQSGKYVSFGDAGSTISIAIRLTSTQLEAYKGNKIVGINYGLPVAGLLNRIDVWVRPKYDGENITSGSIKNPKFGWNEGTLNSPYTITGEEDYLWIGATYTQSRKENAVSFAGKTSNEGCFVNNGSGWKSYDGEGWGSLSLEAVIEGEGIITRDLQLLDVKSTQRSVLIGNDFTVTGVIKNNASKTAEKPVIKYTVNGQHVGTYTCTEDLAFRKSIPFTIDIPTGTVNDVGTAQFGLSLEWADGVADESPADNVASLTTEMTRRVFDRRMVVEEHTGAWCGWCVRGIVGLRDMKAKYGDNFIGIAIHNGDLYSQTAEATAYDNFIGGYMQGYPNSVINRVSGPVDPLYSTLESRYQKMEKVADAEIKVDASYADGKITMNSHSEFTYSDNNTDYRVAFVILENKLPIVQTNNYAGGTVMGGFEKLGSPCKVDVDDVARGIYPEGAGKKGAIPTQITEGVIYDYTYTATMPSIKDGGNVEVVALLINGATGEIINANKTDKIEGLSSGQSTDDPNDPANKVTHTLSPATGATVETLDKVVVSFSGKLAEMGMNHVGYYNLLASNYGASPISISSRPYLRDNNGKTVAKAARVMWTYNPEYPSKSNQPYKNNEFELDFDGVPAGHYTLVVPKNFFVYYDERDNILTTDEFSAEYTVTKSTEPKKGLYNARFSPAENSQMKELKTINLYSSSDIYTYYCDDLALYYNYFYVEEPVRPYVILPDGNIRDAKTVDFVEVTGGTATEQQIQMTFTPSYTEGCYTLVIPDDYIVVGSYAGKLGGDDNYEAYAARERRFNFYIGDLPEGLTPVEADHSTLPAYDIWGRMTQDKGRGITISGGKKILK